jgi:hypothetical protein
MVEEPTVHYHATKRSFGYTVCGDPDCTRPQVEQRPLGVPASLVKIASGLCIAAAIVGALIFLNYFPRIWHKFQIYPEAYELCRQQQPESDTVLELLDRVRECHRFATNVTRGPKGK